MPYERSPAFVVKFVSSFVEETPANITITGNAKRCVYLNIPRGTETTIDNKEAAMIIFLYGSFSIFRLAKTAPAKKNVLKSITSYPKTIKLIFLKELIKKILQIRKKRANSDTISELFFLIKKREATKI